MRVGTAVLLTLACLAIATAPGAAADSGDDDTGKCVWTSQHGTSVSAGYNVEDCRKSGGSFDESD